MDNKNVEELYSMVESINKDLILLNEIITNLVDKKNNIQLKRSGMFRKFRNFRQMFKKKNKKQEHLADRIN